MGNNQLLNAFMLNLALKRLELDRLAARLEACRLRDEDRRERAAKFWNEFAALGFNINRIDPNDPANALERPENVELSE